MRSSQDTQRGRKTIPALFAVGLGVALLSALGSANKLVRARPPGAAAGSVVINEIAWAGTDASPNDEWIELYNPTATPIDLNGWTLAAADGTPTILLSGVIPADGFFLLERTADTTVSDIPADQLYTGALSNGGEQLTLTNGGGATIDTANGDGGGWPAGTTGSGTPPVATMERINPYALDSDANWRTNDGVTRNGQDANGNPLNGTPQAANSGFAAPSPSPTGTFTPTTTATSTATATPSPTGTSTSTATATGTSTATATATAVPVLAVVINEVGWAGTTASADDEWLELHNPGPNAVDLAGWTLSDGGDLAVALSGVIPAGGYYLLERTDDTTISDIAADQIYAGGLSNAGETLVLMDPSGTPIDTANGDGGPWPAGDPATRSTMERSDANASDSAANWGTNDGLHRNGRDANGDPLNGTPRQPNSTLLPTATPTFTPTVTPTPTSQPALAVVINEVGWAGTTASAHDEWIELHNPGPNAIDLAGWTLRDGGDIAISLSGVIAAGGYHLLERTDDTTISDIAADQIYTGGLSNDGEALTLYDPSGAPIDTANGDGGPWPAGDDETRATMERRSPAPDSAAVWSTAFRHGANGLDANAGAVWGTPRSLNSLHLPYLAHPALHVNEVLPNPGSDWTIYETLRHHSPYEYVELINDSDETLDVSFYLIDDIAGGGSKPYMLTGGSIMGPRAIWILRSRDTGISLNDTGDTVRLLYPDGSLKEDVSWTDAGDDQSVSRSPDGTGPWHFDWQPSPGMINRAHPAGSRYGPPLLPPVVDLRTARTFDDGAWITIAALVTGPFPLFGNRVIYVQDESGAGIAVYVNRGEYPAMQIGQRITATGRLRTRSGERQLYVTNMSWFNLGEPAPPPAPLPVGTGVVGEALEGTLVVVTGRVVRLESNAFWLDDGSGRTRVFFGSRLPFERPAMRRGQTWTAVGIVGEFTTVRSTMPGIRIRVRQPGDVYELSPTATLVTGQQTAPRPPAVSLPGGGGQAERPGPTGLVAVAKRTLPALADLGLAPTGLVPLGERRLPGLAELLQREP